MIADLITLDGFQRFLERIRDLEKGQQEAFVACDDEKEMFRTQGAIVALQAVLDLPDQMIVEEKEFSHPD